MFLSDEFSIFLAIVCFVLAIIFFLGKGEKIINAFNSRNIPAKKKRSPEDEKKYQWAFGVFCLVLGIGEIITVVFSAMPLITSILCIVIVVADLIWVTIYIRKHFPS